MTPGTGTTEEVTTGAPETSGTPGSPGTTVSPNPAGETTVVTGATDSPVTAGTTIKVTTTDPLKYVSVRMDNNLSPIDAKHVLQNALILSNTVVSLTNELKQLENELDPTNSPLITELATMLQNATAMNATLISLNNQLVTLSAQQTNMTQTYNTTLGFYQCLAASNCVTYAPTTTLGTTTTPMLTTTPKWVSCPANPQANNDTTAAMTFTLPATENIRCTQTISAGTLNVDLNVTVAITNTAQLKISDAYTGNTIQTFAASASGVIIHTNTSLVQLDYSAQWEGNSIQFDIVYKAADACEGKDCMNGGKCQLTSTGEAHCICSGCYSLDANGLCTIATDPCTSTAKRLCKTGNPCKTNTESVNECTYYCQCNGQDDLTAKSCATAGAPSFFERWL